MSKKLGGNNKNTENICHDLLSSFCQSKIIVMMTQQIYWDGFPRQHHCASVAKLSRLLCWCLFLKTDKLDTDIVVIVIIILNDVVKVESGTKKIKGIFRYWTWMGLIEFKHVIVDWGFVFWIRIYSSLFDFILYPPDIDLDQRFEKSSAFWV